MNWENKGVKTVDTDDRRNKFRAKIFCKNKIRGLDNHCRDVEKDFLDELKCFTAYLALSLISCHEAAKRNSNSVT